MNEIFRYLDELVKYNAELSEKAIKSNMDRFWSACSGEYQKLASNLKDEESIKAFSLIVNEILLQQMHSILVAIDGGEWISEKYRFDIVDKESNTIVNEKYALHEAFFDYLWSKRTDDPFRTL